MRKVKHPCLPKWRARVAKALKRGYFTAADVRDSGSWNACACGEAKQRYNISTYCDGVESESSPTDRTLRNLGFEFHTQIEYGKAGGNDLLWIAEGPLSTYIKKADAVLDKIEARLTQLMARL